MKKLISSFLFRLLKPPRILRFTKLGSVLILFAFGIGLAAMNTGNNLLYMIFGMVLGFITASGIISEMSLRGLDLDWILEQEFYALKPATLRLILRNSKKKNPSFGIEVTVEISGKNEQSGNYSLEHRFLAIPAKSHEYADLIFVPANRGAYLLKRIKIETRFPFGFFRKYFFKELDKEFIVYPQIVPLAQAAVNARAELESRSVALKGSGDSFWGLKDFVEGDNPRLISWKNSAKVGKIVVRETERETEQKLWICLEPLEKWKQLNESELESAISFAASYLLEKFKHGFAIGLISEKYRIAPRKDKRTVREILKTLALFEPDALPSSPPSPLKGEGGKRGESHFSLAGVVREEQVEILSLWRKFGNVG